MLDVFPFILGNRIADIAVNLGDPHTQIGQCCGLCEAPSAVGRVKLLVSGSRGRAMLCSLHTLPYPVPPTSFVSDKQITGVVKPLRASFRFSVMLRCVGRAGSQDQWRQNRCGSALIWLLFLCPPLDQDPLSGGSSVIRGPRRTPAWRITS